MSSTNRSKARDLHIADYYKTPIDEIVKFLDEFTVDEDSPIEWNTKILDPCSGGFIGKDKMSYPEALHKCGFGIHNGVNTIDTIDIREDSLANIKGDYLHMNCKNKYDVIITNPPFNIALDIIKKALDDIKYGGYIIMLLRLNFLEGKNRKEFWDDNMAERIYVHHSRMSFTDDGKTDSCAYATYVWKKGYTHDFAKIKVI